MNLEPESLSRTRPISLQSVEYKQFLHSWGSCATLLFLSVETYYGWSLKRAYFGFLPTQQAESSQQLKYRDVSRIRWTKKENDVLTYIVGNALFVKQKYLYQGVKMRMELMYLTYLFSSCESFAKGPTTESNFSFVKMEHSTSPTATTCK